MDRKITLNWAVALLTAAAYLVVSIPLNAWAWSWLIWVAYAAYRFIRK